MTRSRTPSGGTPWASASWLRMAANPSVSMAPGHTQLAAHPMRAELLGDGLGERHHAALHDHVRNSRRVVGVDGVGGSGHDRPPPAETRCGRPPAPSRTVPMRTSSNASVHATSLASPRELWAARLVPVVTAMPSRPPSASAAAATTRSGFALPAHVPDYGVTNGLPTALHGRVRPPRVPASDRHHRTVGYQHLGRGQAHTCGATDDQVATVPDAQVHFSPLPGSRSRHPPLRLSSSPTDQSEPHRPAARKRAGRPEAVGLERDATLPPSRLSPTPQPRGLPRTSTTARVAASSSTAMMWRRDTTMTYSVALPAARTAFSPTSISCG